MRPIAVMIIALMSVLSAGTTTAQDATADELRSLMDAVFPGNREVLIEGAYTTFDNPPCWDAVPFDALRYQKPMGFIQAQDSLDLRDPESESLFANVLVRDLSNAEVVFPANIGLAAVMPDLDSLDTENLLPLMKNASSPEITEPRAAARVEVVKGEAFADVEHFNRNPIGKILYMFDNTQARWLVEVRRMAFDFVVENSRQASLHVRGAIHDVIFPWYLTYTDLHDSQNSFLLLSGIAYTVGEPSLIQIETQEAGGEVQYSVHLETMVVLKDAAQLSPVPLTLTFTATQDEVDMPYGGEIVSFEITIDDEILDEYATPLRRNNPIIWFVEGDTGLSGDVRASFSDGCDGYLQMDLLFRDIPLRQE